MRVDADAQPGADDVVHDVGQLRRQHPAVGVAQHDDVGPGLGRHPQHLEGVVAVGSVAVEEVLGVEEHALPLGPQVRHGVADHREVLLAGGAQGPLDVPNVRLRDEGDDAGATHVQGTANGYGERSGNANLFSVVAALEVKLGKSVLPPGRLQELARVAHAVSEVANIAPDPHQPWVGQSAFAHKAGLHVSAIKADPDLYQHCDPAAVGNDMRLLVSELAGRATVELKGKALGLEPDRDTVTRVIERVKDLESVGYSFEAAEASFELLLREEMGERPRYFDLESWRVIVESRGEPAEGRVVSEATVKLHAKGERIVATGEGNGPVHALDTALRLALERLYPDLAKLELVDYKVRIVSGAHGTAAVTRVLVETSDGTTEWDTVGVHENVIAASWQALEDAYTSGLLRQGIASA